MSGDPPVVVSVTGGSAGIEASWQEAGRLASRFDDLGDRLRACARATLSVAGDSDLLESGLLCPSSAAVAEAAVLAAAGALAPVAGGFEAEAGGVRCALAGLRAVDESTAVAMDAVDYALVRAATTSLLVSPGALAGAAALVALDGQGLATSHPTVVEHVANGGGGLLDALRHPFEPVVGTATTAAGARLLLSAYGPERGARLRRYPGAVPTTPPTSVRGLVAALHEVAELSRGPESPGNGTIAVQTLSSPGGRRHLVYLPGTDEFERPSDRDDDVREMQTNLELATGAPDPYTAGIRAALHEAGVRPGEPVLLVGHSQGGMAAAALAADPGALGGVTVTDVVTVGSPTAQVHGFPAGTHVLSLEQRGDVVPLLDGAPNRDSVEQTTVVFDAHPGESVISHHDYDTYLSGAGLADHSTAPSVVEAVGSLDEHGFLSGAGPGTSTTTQLFQVTRAPAGGG